MVAHLRLATTKMGTYPQAWHNPKTQIQEIQKRNEEDEYSTSPSRTVEERIQNTKDIMSELLKLQAQLEAKFTELQNISAFHHLR